MGGFLVVDKDIQCILPYNIDIKKYERLIGNTTQEILNIININPNITRDGIANKLNLTSDRIKYNMNKLKKDGVIVHRGSTKKGYWEILK